MRILVSLLAVTVLLASPLRAGLAQTFEEEQRQYSRVEQAFQNQQAHVQALYAERGLQFPPREVFFRVIKRERVVEVWSRADTESPFELLTAVDICYFSGVLGPKRRQGDRQHPEGFYEIDRFNPRSSWHLSLRISYPNESDRILGDPVDPGDDIFIHGVCGSSGCLAMTNERVELLYVIAVIARSNGQERIPIHIFPIRFTPEDIAWLEEVTFDRELWRFWNNLRPGYDYFETHRQVPTIEVARDGSYVVL